MISSDSLTGSQMFVFLCTVFSSMLCLSFVVVVSKVFPVSFVVCTYILHSVCVIAQFTKWLIKPLLLLDKQLFSHFMK